MLRDSDTYTTIPVSDLERARHFYSETLGLSPAVVTEGGVVYRSGSTQFFVYPSAYKASGHTQMSWVVGDIKADVAALRARGIEFEEFDRTGVKTVDGIAPRRRGARTGAQVATPGSAASRLQMPAGAGGAYPLGRAYPPPASELHLSTRSALCWTCSR